MRDEFVRYAHRLESLSITELSQGAEKLVSSERRQVAALIAHLAEISRRKGHLELGYKSLFDYCVIRLRLGKNSVWNRTQVANVSRRFPQILEHLAEGKSSLSSLGVLAAHLSEENVDGLLEQAEGKTKEEDHAGYQCEYTGPDGVRCTARTRLEIDHIDPVGKGGSSGEENLRVLCRGHNLLLAEREFGEEFMRGKIEGRKSGQRGVA